MYYEDVFRQLNKSRVRYVVAGGIALVLHGVMRLTADLDIVVDLCPRNIDRFIRAMNSLGYRPKMPVKAIEFSDPEKRKAWIKKREMKVFTFYHPRRKFELVDVFVGEPIPFSELHRERKTVVAGRIKIPIVSVRHLKKMKKMAGRPQDLADIKSLNNLEEINRGRK